MFRGAPVQPGTSSVQGEDESADFQSKGQTVVHTSERQQLKRQSGYGYEESAERRKTYGKKNITDAISISGVLFIIQFSTRASDVGDTVDQGRPQVPPTNTA